jgi:hypothetical protein
MDFDLKERVLIRLGDYATEAMFVTATGSWAVILPGLSSGALGVARRHIVTIRSLDDPGLLISLPVEDNAVAESLGELAALGSRSHSLLSGRRACAAVFASLAPFIALVELGSEPTADTTSQPAASGCTHRLADDRNSCRPGLDTFGSVPPKGQLSKTGSGRVPGDHTIQDLS